MNKEKLIAEMRVTLACIAIFMISCKKPACHFSEDGRIYHLSRPCIASHSEMYFAPVPMGKTVILQPRWKTVCDEYGVDTIWDNDCELVSPEPPKE